MKQVYSAPDLIVAQMLKDYLLTFQIECIVKGDMLIGAVGEIPADTYPTVWVLDDADYDKAKALVEKYENNQSEDQVFNNVWKCEDCDELIDAQFTQCWNCGKERIN